MKLDSSQKSPYFSLNLYVSDICKYPFAHLIILAYTAFLLRKIMARKSLFQLHRESDISRVQKHSSHIFTTPYFLKAARKAVGESAASQDVQE